MKIGYSGPFPPHPSGGAALSYWLLAGLAVKRSDMEVYGYSTTSKPIWAPGVKNPINPLELNSMLFYYSCNILKHFFPQLKGRVLLVAHHGFDNVVSTAEELAKSLSDADVVIATDKWEKSIFEGAGLQNVVVVPYPTDTFIFVPKPKENPIEILYTGRLLVYKGIIQLLQAVDHILGKEPNVRFRVHGYIDAKWNGCIDIAKELKSLLDKYPNRAIIEEGWTMPWDMPKVYEGAHIFVFPSGRASFGIPMAEAMSMEIPVVTTSYGSHGEVVGDAGIKLKPTVEVSVNHVYTDKTWTNLVPSADDIQDALLNLVSNSELREKLGKAGRERVKKLFDTSIVTDKLLEVINENSPH